MTGWILRIILLLVIIRLIWRFVSGILEGLMPERAASQRRMTSVPLVRDPVCGTYVVRARAISANAGGETQYFCSEKCRDAYAHRRR
jgi:uncharacterized protein